MGHEIPVSNRPATLMGLSISFTILALSAVVFRLLARIKLAHGLGFDDVFVVLAILTGITTTIAICLCVQTGLGLPLDWILPSQPSEVVGYLHTYYVVNATYVMNTGLIKASLLFQYLRIFSSGIERRLSQVLLVLVFLWGFAFSFMTWFPCFPVDAFWEASIAGHSRACYGFGKNKITPFAAAYIVHAATNMALDICVYLIPILPIWRKHAIEQRQRFGMLIIFGIGAVVLCVSIARLVILIVYQHGWGPDINWTFRAPLIIICGVIEIRLAIIAASTPIFWPAVEAKIDKICVTREVRVETHREGPRQSSDAALQLEECGSMASSHSHESKEALHQKANALDAFRGSFMCDPDPNKGHSVKIETNVWSKS